MQFTKYQFTYTGQETLPDFWKKYFVMSTEGNEYTVLVTDTPKISTKYVQECSMEEIEPNVSINVCQSVSVEVVEDLIMCDTEYEKITQQEFYDVCSQYTNPKVLSLGYGIGLINAEMANQNAKLTVIEKYQEVLDVNDIPEDIITVIGDVEDFDFSTLAVTETLNGVLIDAGKYDVIYCDCDNPAQSYRKEELEGLLKEGGQVVYWKG